MDHVLQCPTKMTRHATTRRQQRGVPMLVIDLLLGYGASERAGAGVTTYFFDKPARRQVLAYAGPLAAAIKPFLDYYAVVGEDQQVITVAPRLGKVQHH